jgi:alanine dehydrogenase
MIVGVPTEIKNNENRVALTPAGVHELVSRGHRCLVQQGAGLGSGITDAEYAAAGGELTADADNVYQMADLIVKVKEPLASEYGKFRKGQLLFTYLHLAASRELTQAMLDAGITGIAYETVQLPNGVLPLLSPMSEVAGRMSVQVGAALLQKYNGGMGILLGGVPGVSPAEVVIVGGGVVGTNAARMAVGLGARVTVLDINPARLVYLDDIFGGRITTLVYNAYVMAEVVKTADLLIGAVLVPGAKAPKTVTEPMVKTMKKGSVIVDVAIDQGGSIATIDRVTTHDHPCYEKHGVIHYSVANIPGAVPRTATWALTNTTLPYLVKLADKGLDALREDKALLAGLNLHDGKLTCEAVATAFDLPWTPANTIPGIPK